MPHTVLFHKFLILLHGCSLSLMYALFDETGRDFGSGDPVDVPTQVSLLVMQATSHESLCQCYIGWYVLIRIQTTLSPEKSELPKNFEIVTTDFHEIE